jgi:protein TonB
MDDVARHTSYRTARALERATRRTRALARIPVARRVDGVRVADPLACARTRQERAGRAVPVWVAASLVAHVGVAMLGVLLPAGRAHADDSFDQAVEVIEPPKPPEPPPPPPTEKPPEQAEPIAARPTKTVTEPPKPTPTDEPPPDPTEPPKVAPDPTPTKPTRRVIGLNLDSTVAGGSGPSFAAGNTRMGETSRVASDPNGIAALPNAQLVPPRRTHEVQPEYPPALRAQNVEGEVVLKVDVDASGHVSGVTIEKPSKEAAFNSAAVAAAKASTYAPALMNGAPVANTIQFTVRFRLKH